MVRSLSSIFRCFRFWAFAEVPILRSFLADLALAEDAEITPEYAQKLASNLAGRRLRMFLPREGDGDPDYVWVRLAADVLGIGLSAVVVGYAVFRS